MLIWNIKWFGRVGTDTVRKDSKISLGKPSRTNERRMPNKTFILAGEIANALKLEKDGSILHRFLLKSGLYEKQTN